MLRPEARFVTIAVALSMVSGAAPAAAEWVDWIADASVSFEYNDNLNVSAFNSDEENDLSWHPVAALGRTYQLADRTRLSLTGEVSGEIYHDFNRLNSVEGGGRLALFHKFGIGNAPWLRASFFGGYKDVGDSKRSGRHLAAQLTGGKRFHPRFDAFLSYLFTDRSGGRGEVAVPTIGTDVFDQQYHQLTLAGNFLALPRLLVTAGYTFRYGDFDSACTGANVGRVLAQENVEAIALDGAGGSSGVFGGCVYRLTGPAHAGVVNVSYGLTDRFSLDAAYEYRYGKADTLDYQVNIARLALVFRY